MSTTYRRAVVVTFGVVVSSLWLPPKNDAGAAGQHTRGEQAEAEKPVLLWPPDDPDERDSLNEPCEHEEDNRESDLCAQWKAADAARDSADWAGLTFWLGVGGAVIGVLTLTAAVAAAWFARHAAQETRRNADEARRSADIAERKLLAEERPFLSINIRGSLLEIDHQSQEGIADLWQNTFCNMGLSNAMLDSIAIKTEYLLAGKEPDPIDPDTVAGRKFPYGIIISPKDVVHIQWFHVEEREHQVGIKNAIGKFSCFHHGFIRYKAVGGVSYITGFCIAGEGEGAIGAKKIVPYLIGGPKLNYYRAEDSETIPESSDTISGKMPIIV